MGGLGAALRRPNPPHSILECQSMINPPFLIVPPKERYRLRLGFPRPPELRQEGKKGRGVGRLWICSRFAPFSSVQRKQIPQVNRHRQA